MLPEGAASIDNIRFEFKRFIDAESALQLVALMPEQQTMLGFDLMFGPNDHVFTVTAHFENWIAILESLISLPSTTVFLAATVNQRFPLRSMPRVPISARARRSMQPRTSLWSMRVE